MDADASNDCRGWKAAAAALADAIARVCECVL